MSTIDKARCDARIQTILSEVSAKAKLKFLKSGQDEWSSNLEKRKAVIGYCGCRNPSAALAHELLHIDAQLRGYRRMRVFVTLMAERASFKRLLDCLDNELQHHKLAMPISLLELSKRQIVI
jgi:hypothetical protein